MELSNQLAHEKSPYLQQHKSNPVAWHPWGKEAFELAKKLDRPIFLSIGYATCHWCHVMEGDSFESNEVAEILNRGFVPIKVDREELPDVDAFYMSAVQAQTGRGGWPLSAFLAQDGKPFWTGTFIPRARFMMILSELEKLWQSDRSEILKAANTLTEHLGAPKEATRLSVAEVPVDAMSKNLRLACARSFDESYGGFSHAPKFPPSLSLMSLMRLEAIDGVIDASHMIRYTLSSMLRAGLRDHIGGGFHRYATDEEWRVPHFEKMLYDNALLISTLCSAKSLYADDEFGLIAHETIAYLLRDLYDQEHQAFYSAEDADSEKCEGKFYLWTYDELQSVLSPDEFNDIQKLYGVSEEGNFEVEKHVSDLEKAAGLSIFENGNIFHLGPKHSFSFYKESKYQSIREKLLAIRAKRIRPLRDIKMITSWNALSISALAQASVALETPRYYDLGKACAEFLLNTCAREGRLYRRYCEGELKFAAALEDYAFTVKALLDLYKASWDQSWLEKAFDVQQTLHKIFWDEPSQCYRDSDGQNLSFSQKAELHDHAIPSGNSIACQNLYELANLSLNLDMRATADAIFAHIAPSLARFPQAFASFFSCLPFVSPKNRQVLVLEGPDGLSEDKKRLLKERSFFGGFSVVLGTQKEGSISYALSAHKALVNNATTFYVCHWGQCEQPTNSLENALKILN